jgi:hypothetical protein
MNNQPNRTYMIVDVSGRGFTATKDFSEIADILGDDVDCDNEPAIDAIESLEVGDKFDCDNILFGENLTACYIIRTI